MRGAVVIPRQKPWRSRQDYTTPWPFFEAVEARFGKMTFDLAASEVTTRVRGVPFDTPPWFGPGGRALDSLEEDWTELRGNLWLNPPFKRIELWARKCAESCDPKRRRIFFLVPASVGANWFANYVHDRALVIFLRPRLSFDERNPFPKDVLLAVYGEHPGYQSWQWKAPRERAETRPRRPGTAAQRLAAARRREQTEAVLREIPGHLVALWDQVKRNFIKGTPHERVTAFLEYAHNHEADAEAALAAKGEEEIERFEIDMLCDPEMTVASGGRS